MQNTLSLAQLPGDDSPNLYVITLESGAPTGIGTAREIRSFVADGILPGSIRMALEWEPR